MAQAQEEGVDFDGDPPIRVSRLDDELEYFSSIDELTKSWVNSLHHIWSLCKFHSFTASNCLYFVELFIK